MGGNLFPKTERLTKEEYDHVLSLFLSHSPKNFTVPCVLQDKESFGDIDVICAGGHTLKDIPFSVDQVAYNGPVTSYCIWVGTKWAQLDVIQSEDPSMHANYLNFGDLGNLIGRTARAIGLKFGHKGLLYPSGEKEYLITNQINQCLAILDYDPIAYWKIRTTEDSYRFALTSKFFNSKYFDVDDGNSVNRVRNNKRKYYQGFLEFLELWSIAPKRKLSPEERFRLIREQISKVLTDEVLYQIFEDVSRDAYLESARAYNASKFNGGLMQSALKRMGMVLSGKELGSLIAQFKKSANPDWEGYLTQSSHRTVQKDMEELADRIANMEFSLATGSRMAKRYLAELPSFLDTIVTPTTRRNPMVYELCEQLLALQRCYPPGTRPASTPPSPGTVSSRRTRASIASTRTLNPNP